MLFFFYFLLFLPFISTSFILFSILNPIFLFSLKPIFLLLPSFLEHIFIFLFLFFLFLFLLSFFPSPPFSQQTHPLFSLPLFSSHSKFLLPILRLQLIKHHLILFLSCLISLKLLDQLFLLISSLFATAFNLSLHASFIILSTTPFLLIIFSQPLILNVEHPIIFTPPIFPCLFHLLTLTFLHLKSLFFLKAFSLSFFFFTHLFILISFLLRINLNLCPLQNQNHRINPINFPQNLHLIRPRHLKTLLHLLRILLSLRNHLYHLKTLLLNNGKSFF